jgi:hypothetical protein
MDDISIWYYKKSQQTNVQNLPRNSEINNYISNAQNLKLIGKFADSWDNEDTANRMILELLFETGKISDYNNFSPKIDITQETQNLIQLENNYQKAFDTIRIQNLLLTDNYYSDLLRYGKSIAAKKKKEKESLNQTLNASLNIIINNYNKEVLRMNIQIGEDRIIAEEREKERIKAEARKALEDSQDIIRNARDEQDRINAPIDTSMNVYMRKKIRADTANEINESTQSTYKHDLVYLFFKMLLFIILGIVFYYLMKDQNPKEILNQVKETTKVVSDKVLDSVKTLKETIQEKGNEIIKSNEIIKV